VQLFAGLWQHVEGLQVSIVNVNVELCSILPKSMVIVQKRNSKSVNQSLESYVQNLKYQKNSLAGCAEGV
jgi:hypothetical protein